VGVSADKPETQRKFIDKFGLTFPMVPDPAKVVIDAFGAREVLGLSAKRKSFLIDPQGHIAFVWPKVKVEGHGDEVVARIRQLAEERK
jgi:peroxiredoxin Q/BCP